MVAVFAEVRRVLADDGVMWLNVGDSYATNGGAHTAGSYDGETGRAMSSGRIRIAPIPEKNLIGIPWRLAFALQDDGWILRSDIIWHKPNPMPESVTDRPTKAHEYVFLFSKQPRYWYDAEAIQERTSGISGGGFSIKTATAQINHGALTLERPIDTGYRNARTVWTISTEPTTFAHFATMPTKLVRRCIVAGCPVGGVVLDPFFGSGTTGLVARKEGRDYIGIELNPEYVALAERRLAQPYTLPMMFAESRADDPAAD